MSGLRLRYRAPRDRDRTLALETSEVSLPRIALQYVTAPSLGGGIQAARQGDVEAAEVLLSDYIAGLANGDDTLTALPVFPVRRSGQRYLFVRRDSDLSTVADLDGRRIGWPLGAATAAIAVRSLLTDAAVVAEFVRGPVGGTLAPKLDRGEKADHGLPQRLVDGDLEALITPYPIPDEDGGSVLRPLLAAPSDDERARMKAGSVIPINTVVALRRDMYAEHHWVACELMDGFAAAQRLGERRPNPPGALAVGLPRLPAMGEEVDTLSSGWSFPYGVERNREYLGTFARFAVELGVAARVVPVDEMFPAEVLGHPGTVAEACHHLPTRGSC